MRFKTIKKAVERLFTDIKEGYNDYDLTKASQCKDLAKDLSAGFFKNYDRIKDNVKEKNAKRYIYDKTYNDNPGQTLKPRGISIQFTRFEKGYPDKIHGNFRNSVEMYTIFLGYMGWNGFIDDPPMKIDAAIIQFPVIKDNKSNNEKSETDNSDSNFDELTAQRVIDIKRIIIEITTVFGDDPVLSSQAIQKKGEDYIRAVYNTLKKLKREQIIEEADNNPDETISKVFDDILKCKKLSEDHWLRDDIEPFFSYDPVLKYYWYHRAILASALSLSVLKYWDYKKVEYLKMLAENDNEPFVSRRAIIGLVLALLVSFNDSQKFETTTQIMSPLKKEVKYVAGIYETLYFFLNEWGKDIEENEFSDIYNDIRFSENYQYFEPPHSKISYYQLENLAFDDPKEENSFFKLLNDSFSLSHVERTGLVRVIKDATKEENKELFADLTKGKDIFDELEINNSYNVYSLYFKQAAEDFQFQIEGLKSYKIIIKRILTNTNIRYIAMAIFKSFPYHRYIKILPDKLQLINDRLNNVDIHLYYDLGAILIDLNRKEDALKAFEKATKLNPKDSYSWYIKGTLLNNFDKKDDALIAFENATEANPQHTESWYNMGSLLEKMDKKRKAVVAYANAIETNPHFEDSWCRMGVLLWDLDDKKMALRVFENATKTNPRHTDAWYKYGLLLQKQDKDTEAFIAYKSVVELNPQHEDAWFLIGLYLSRHDENIKSLKVFEKVIELSPQQNLRAWYMKGTILEKIDKKDEALTAYEEAIKVDPSNIDSRHRLGWCYFTTGHIPEAKEQFKIILKSEKPKLAHMNIGHCELILENKNEAIDNYRKSLDLWNCSQEFFDGFEKDFKYIKPQGITKEEYVKIKEELQQYCQDK